jgi:hypothetical protein
MKKILLLITFGCFAFVAVSHAQTASTVLSPSTPVVKTTMTDSQTPATDAATTDKKSDTKTSCTKSGCTSSKDVKKESCIKPSDKADAKPAFMQDNSTAPVAPKKD